MKITKLFGALALVVVMSLLCLTSCQTLGALIGGLGGGDEITDCQHAEDCDCFKEATDCEHTDDCDCFPEITDCQHSDDCTCFEEKEPEIYSAEGTYTITMTEDLDSENYNEYYANNIMSCLYGGMLLSTQTTTTVVTLELDKENGTYKLIKDAYMGDMFGGTATDGFEFYLTFEGTYTDNHDGTIVLNAPTSGTRYWFIVDLFVAYFDQMAGMGLNYPGCAKPSDALTVDKVYSETEQAVDADGNLKWTDEQETDANGNALYQDELGNTFYKTEADGVTTWYDSTGAVVENPGEYTAKYKPQMAVESYDPKPTTMETDDSIVRWFNGMYVSLSNAPEAQIVTLSEEGKSLVSIETQPSEKANILVDGVAKTIDVTVGDTVINATYTVNEDGSVTVDNEAITIAVGRRNVTVTYGSYVATLGSGALEGGINVASLNNVGSAVLSVSAADFDDKTYTVTSVMSVNGVQFNCSIVSGKLTGISISSSNSSVNASVNNKDGVITVSADGETFVLSEEKILAQALATYPDSIKKDINPASLVINGKAKTIKGKVGNVPIDMTYTVGEDGTVTLSDPTMQMQAQGGNYALKYDFSVNYGGMVITAYAEFSVPADSFTSERLTVVTANDGEKSTAPGYFTINADGSIGGQGGGMVPLGSTYTYTAATDEAPASFVIADPTFVITANGSDLTVVYAFSMPSYGIDFTNTFALSINDIAEFLAE